jgi:hypothetical protein
MRPYAELLATERKKLFRIVIFVFCTAQMFTLITYFSHRGSHMEPSSHYFALFYLVLYPFIALYSLKKQPDPFAISLITYGLLGMSYSILTVLR